MGCSYVLLSLSFLLNWPPTVNFVGFIMFLLFFELSIGPIMWVYCADILPDKAVALTTAINWVTVAFIISLSEVLGNLDVDLGYTYMFYFVACVALFFVSNNYMAVPENEETSELRGLITTN